MSYQRKEPFIHPFNFFIVQTLTNIRFALDQSKITDAFKLLRNFIYFLDPEIKEVLKKERDEMEKLNNNIKALRHDMVYDLLDKVSIALHTAGYFDAAKFGPATKTTTMKEMRMKLEKAIHGNRT